MLRLRFWWGLLGTLLLAACMPAALPATLTPGPASPTPSPAPILMCTAPVCMDGQLTCNKTEGCPGGCGTVCERFTPTPAETRQPVCTAPACENGTLICGDPNGCPGGCGTICSLQTPETPPTITLTATTTTLRVGELTTIVGQVTKLGVPYYQANLQDVGQSESSLLIEITYENTVRQQADPSAVLALGQATGAMAQITLVLQGRAVGETDLTISATGEYMSPNGAMWTGATSAPLRIVVTP